VGAISVVVVASLVALAGWGVVAVLERRTGRPALWWGLVASAALSLSILGPGAAASDAGVLLGLVLLHVVTAAVVMGGLSASLGRRPAVRGC
jgi:putative copper export protein